MHTYLHAQLINCTQLIKCAEKNNEGQTQHSRTNNIVGGLVDLFWRARGARALAARAHMFVTSQVPFFPNQQYKILFGA
jgi:hypothetical protein